MKKYLVVVSICLAFLAGVVAYVRFWPSGKSDKDAPSAQRRVQQNIQSGTGDTNHRDAVPFDYETAYAKLDKASRKALEGMDSPVQVKLKNIYIYGWSHKDKWSGDPEEMQLFLDTLQETKLPDFSQDDYYDYEDVIVASFSFLTSAWVQAGPYPTLEKEEIDDAVHLLSSKNATDAMTAKVGALILLDIIRRTRPDHKLPPDAEAIYQKTMKNNYLKSAMANQIELRKNEAKKAGRPFPGD